MIGGRVNVEPHLLLPPPGTYHAQIADEFTLLTIRADRTVWVLDHPDGPITVGLLRAA